MTTPVAALAVARPRVQSPGEELANSISHGLGAGAGVAALAVMVGVAALDGDPWRIVAGAIYGASVVLLFLSSTLYHAFRKPQVKYVFQVLDHAGIHALIAGTYTPFALVTLRGPWGWGLLAGVWGLAAAGIVFEALFTDRFPRISTAAYLATGWVGVVAVGPLLRALPLAALAWVLAGGLFYSAGVVYFARNRPYDHFVWHLFVLCGAICHFTAVYGYVLTG